MGIMNPNKYPIFQGTAMGTCLIETYTLTIIGIGEINTRYLERFIAMTCIGHCYKVGDWPFHDGCRSLQLRSRFVIGV